jgi:putative RecB family exonuclease
MSTVVDMLRAEKQDLYISASALRCLEACPRQYWLRYVEGHPAQDLPARMVLGSALHRALSAFYTLRVGGEPEPGLDKLVGIASSHIASTVVSEPPVLFADGEDPETLVTEATRLLRAFVEQAPRPTKVLGVEMPFSLPLVHPETGEVLPFEEHVVGAIDLLTEEHDGTVVVWDHKVVTRLDRQKAERPDLQLGLYAWAVRQTVAAKKVELRYQDIVRTKNAKVEVQTVARVPHDEAEAVEATAAGLHLVHAAVGRKSGKVLMGRRRSWRCADCGWRRRCEENRG